MNNRLPGLIATGLFAGVCGFMVAVSTTTPSGQTARPPRVAGKPNLTGIWQAANEANWDLEAHEARAGAVTQPGAFPHLDFVHVPAAPVLALGAAGGVPASVGVVLGDGKIPYKPEALSIKRENAAHWIDRDPELKCYLPGLPRATYMPYPFEIVQGTQKIHMLYSFSNAARTIHLEKVEQSAFDAWMGFSEGRWEGETLVVNVSSFNDRTWFDRAGNFHSDALKIEERFTPISDHALQYEVTIDDPKTFTRPWKIAMPLYRRLEPNGQLLEYRCIEFVEEFLYGHLRKNPLVTRWESETMTIDIRRKVPPGERVNEWYRR
jgi:hypothetical protein